MVLSFDRIIGASARIYADHFPRFRRVSSALKSGEISNSLEGGLLVAAFLPEGERSRHFMRHSRHFLWLKSKAPAWLIHDTRLRAHAPGYRAETFPFSVLAEAKRGEISCQSQRKNSFARL